MCFMCSFFGNFVHYCFGIPPDLVPGWYETSAGMYFSSDAVFFVPDSRGTPGPGVAWYSTIVTQVVTPIYYNWFAIIC